jgi:hypothetical protein
MKKSKLIQLLEKENDRLNLEIKVLNELFVKMVDFKNPITKELKVKESKVVENCEIVKPIEIIQSIGKKLNQPLKITRVVNVQENENRCKYLYEMGYRLKKDDILTPTGRICYNTLNRIHYKSKEGRQLSVKFEDFIKYSFKVENENPKKIKNLPPQNLVVSHK